MSHYLNSKIFFKLNAFSTKVVFIGPRLVGFFVLPDRHLFWLKRFVYVCKVNDAPSKVASSVQVIAEVRASSPILSSALNRY